MSGNMLYYGDNLDVLRRYVANASVDLVYLDPPFNSKRDYNVLFAEQDGSRSTAQIKAFGDTWRWDRASAAAYEEIVEGGGNISRAMQGFRQVAGESDILAYLSMMVPRLVELHRVLKSTGSLYLHCDPTASHYLKILLDAIFGPRNFQNEVVWWYRKWSKSTNHFLRNHDVLPFYSKDPKHTFNILQVPLSPSTLRRFGGKKQDFADEARTRKITLDEDSKGGFRPDVWDINLLPARAAERLGYPTQKPLALLRPIIEASSNEGDVVLDPFCGCGTSIVAAQEMGRQWIGIDITHLAAGLIKHRLLDIFRSDIANTYTVIGEPTTVEDAAQLAQEDPFQFQAWALGLVGARTAESNKKGADKGIDGRLFFHDELRGKTKQIIFSVKAGKLHAPHVRDLRGVIDREKAEIGVLLSFDAPTQPMRTEAASAGFYESSWGKHPRLQTLTVAELLAGKTVDYPRGAANQTLRRAPRAKLVSQPLTLELDGD